LGSQSFEPKYGLRPLIFGTLKATLYSMLFGAPLALLAAIFTSEFLHPQVRSKVKPVIELMASLPSVVLGFLAALIFAPLVARAVPAVLVSFVSLPLAFLTGAHLWQLLPQNLGLRLSRWRFLFIVAALPAGILAALRLGPSVERWLFAGDIRLWLNGQVGSGTGGWMFVLLPLCGIGTFLLGRELNSWLRVHTHHWSRARCAALQFTKFLAGTAFALGGAWLLALLLNTFGWDPRGAYVGTYDQRNTLIVGVVMGFAIIPLIYTIAEDALSTVPEHLRSASLGAGATQWQTATRIVVPIAMSGLFTALMIGLGRAVGETMIVLMATGNTPVMEWNVFNGLRSLSATIASELPEAPLGSTHYRTLFFAALCLFMLTFVVNTAAELVRLRFRRRAHEL
jgi:phosphate transport system permease protein